MIWSILCNLPEFTTWTTFEHIQWYSLEIPCFSDFHCHWKGFWDFSTEFHLKFHCLEKTSKLKNISNGIPYDSYIGILRPFKTSNPVILKFLEKFRERFRHSVFSRFLTFSISINLSFYQRSVRYSIWIVAIFNFYMTPIMWLGNSKVINKLRLKISIGLFSINHYR